MLSLPLLSNYHTTVLLKTLLLIFSSPGAIELTTQLLILLNILCLPCVESINLGEILPSKTVVILYTCGSSISHVENICILFILSISLYHLRIPLYLQISLSSSTDISSPHSMQVLFASHWSSSFLFAFFVTLC